MISRNIEAECSFDADSHPKNRISGLASASVPERGCQQICYESTTDVDWVLRCSSPICSECSECFQREYFRFKFTLPRATTTPVKRKYFRFKFTNCYSGWGGKELDGGKDCGTMSVADCQAKCDKVPDCMSITWDTVSQKCFRRGYVR